MTVLRRKSKTIIQEQFLEIALAYSLLELSRGLTCIADGIMTSRLVGAEELAGFGIVSPYYSIVAVISIFLTISCQTMFAKSLGKGDLSGANICLSGALRYGLVISAVLTVFGIIFAEPLCFLFGARGNSASLMPYAKEYLRALLLGSAGNVLLAILSPIVELDGGSKWVKWSGIVMMTVNIAGNYITTKYLNMGLMGIGLSSSLGFYGAAITVSMHFFSKKSQLHLKSGKHNHIALKEFVRIGYPGAISMFCRAVCPIIVNSMILAVAVPEAMSAVSAQANIKFLIWAPLSGIAGAVLALGNIAYGERDVVSLKEIMTLAARYIIIGIVLFSALVFSAAPLIAGCYFAKGTDVYSLAVNAIRCFALSLPFTAFNLSIISYFQILDKKIPLLIMYICNELICVAVCTVVLGSLFSVLGIWTAIAVGPLILSVITLAVLFFNTQKNPGICLPLLPKNFGISEKDRAFFTVNTMAAVMKSSEQIHAFCLKRGIGRKKAEYTALLIEEVAGNVIQHGFTDSGKHQVDIRVVVERDTVIMKITDNCRRFDFNSRVKSIKKQNEDVGANLGLKIALGLTQNITYLNTSNKNILVLTI